MSDVFKNDFKKIDENSKKYIKNIQNGIDINENFNNLLIEFKPIMNKIIKKVKHNGNIDGDDLEQEAMIVLWKCCETYDFNTGAMFYAYYYNCVFRELNNYVDEFQAPYSVNKHEKRRMQELKAFARSYYDEYKKYPGVKEYVESGFDESIAKRCYSFFANIFNDCCLENKILKNESLDIENDYLDKELVGILLREIEKLNEKCKQIIKMRYFDELTYREIGIRMNISPTTVRKYEKKALSILKKRLSKFI